MNKLCVVFDLDDTLYKEIDYLKSAFMFIARNLSTEQCNAEVIFNLMYTAYRDGRNAFSAIKTKLKTDTPIDTFLLWYRTHVPDIVLPLDSKKLLDYLYDNNIPMGILTDGRSMTQRNKIKSLGLYRYVPHGNIIISEEFGSEKPCEANYSFFESLFPNTEKFIYIGDNPKKDFLAPNRLGWDTIGLVDDGRNIHKQEPIEEGLEPKIWIQNFSDGLIPIINFIMK